MKYKIIHIVFFITAGLFSSCREKLEDKDIPEVDLVMLESSEPKLNRLNEAIEEDTENALLFYKRAKVYYEMNNQSKALEDINQAIFLDDEQPKFHFLLGKIYEKLGKNNLAVKAAEKSVELGNQEAGVFIFLADLYLGLDDREKASMYLNLSKSVAPYHAEVAYLQAKYNLGLTDTATALKGLMEAIQKNKDFTKPYAVLAAVYEAKKMDDSAMYFIIKGIESSHEKAPLYYYQGKILERQGLNKSSILSYHASAQQDSSFVPVYYKLGSIALTNGDTNKAVAYLSNYYKYNFTNKEVNLILAGLYEKKGFGEKAISIYEQVLSQDTGHAIAKISLKKLYAIYGEKTRPVEKLNPVAVKKETEKPVAVVVEPEKVAPVPAVKKDTAKKMTEPAPPKPAIKTAKKDTVKPMDETPVSPVPEEKPDQEKKDEIAVPKPEPAPAPEEISGEDGEGDEEKKKKKKKKINSL